MTYSLRAVPGASLKDSPFAEQILRLDRKHMESILREVGLDFPEERRRATLFHPSNHVIVAESAGKLAGYVDCCDYPTDPRDVYLSSIQIESEHRGGPLFKLLVSALVAYLRSRDFKSIRVQVQKSNARMIEIVRKAGFAIEENPEKPATLNAVAPREILDSPRLRQFA